REDDLEHLAPLATAPGEHHVEGRLLLHRGAVARRRAGRRDRHRSSGSDAPLLLDLVLQLDELEDTHLAERLEDRIHTSHYSSSVLSSVVVSSVAGSSSTASASGAASGTSSSTGASSATGSGSAGDSGSGSDSLPPSCSMRASMRPTRSSTGALS